MADKRTTVTITLKVSVDTEAWELTYGCQDVAVDLREYIPELVAQCAAAEECGLEVQVVRRK